MSITLALPYDADTYAAGAIALREARQVAESEEFAEAVIEAPKLLGIVDVTPGVVSIGLSVTVRTSASINQAPQRGYILVRFSERLSLTRKALICTIRQEASPRAAATARRHSRCIRCRRVQGSNCRLVAGWC